MKQVPRQRNANDCGLFVLFYIERFLKEAPKRLKEKDLSMVRLSLVHVWLYLSNVNISTSNHINYHLFFEFVSGCYLRAEYKCLYFWCYQFSKQWFRPEEASNLRWTINDLLVGEFKIAKEKETAALSPEI
jgi:hypothetical protein